MNKHIIINGNLYKLKAKDIKRLTLSTQTERVIERGNKIIRQYTEDTSTILLNIIDTYEPIAEVLGIFNI